MLDHRHRLPLYLALVAAAVQVVVDRISGMYGWGTTHPHGDLHLLVSLVFYGAAGWYGLRSAVRCRRSAASRSIRISGVMAVGLGGAVAAWYAFDSLCWQQTSAHYQGPEHRLAFDVTLVVLAVCAVVDFMGGYRAGTKQRAQEVSPSSDPNGT